ncbi:hypothetical protein RND81_07G184500 [Saponaria officinalis]|uniref:Retrotransposon Copia-like N-terminal domain-containing protein n=1 Tax=Saponaria officinalis TaxID=3572 RepID=A0AAW1JQ16_SAPOF
MAGNEDEGEKKVDMTYFLGSSDNPGTVITPIQLRGPNYDEWARAIRTSLQAKRKYGFIEGKISKPTTPEKLEDWMVVHSMLVAWLLNTIEPSIRSTLSYYDDAQALWTHLKQRFCVVNGTRIFQLKAALGECRQARDEDVSAYFGRLFHIWDEMTTYIKTPTCKCGKCTCSIETQVNQLRDEKYLHHFLFGLDNAYSTIRSQLLAQEPLPHVDVAYQRVAQDKSLRRGDFSTRNTNRDNLMAFKINFNGRNKNKTTDHSSKFCRHCNQNGHDVTTCFQIHGYPDWWGDRPKLGRGSSRDDSKAGRGDGHGKGGITNTSVRAHKVGNGASSSTSFIQTEELGLPSSTNMTGLAGITPSQWQQILDLMNIPKSKDRLHGPEDEDIDWSG